MGEFCALLHLALLQQRSRHQCRQLRNILGVARGIGRDAATETVYGRTKPVQLLVVDNAHGVGPLWWGGEWWSSLGYAIDLWCQAPKRTSFLPRLRRVSATHTPRVRASPSSPPPSTRPKADDRRICGGNKWSGQRRVGTTRPATYWTWGTAPAKVPFLRGFRFSQPVTPPPRPVTIAALIKKARQKRWGNSTRLPQTTPPQRSNAPLTLFQGKCKIPSFSFLEKL